MEIQKLIKNYIKIGVVKNTPPRKYVHIALCADRNVIRPLGVTIFSILKNIKQPCMFHIFFNGMLPTKEQDKFYDLAGIYNTSIIFYSVDNTYFSQFHSTKAITVTTYYRLIIPYYFETIGIDTFLYVDTDILCLQDISTLFTEDLKDKIAYVVKNSKYVQAEQIRYRTSIGINQDEYFNAGVLLVRTIPYVRNDIGQKAIQLATTKAYHDMDQDILNILLRGKVIFDSEYFYNFTMQIHDDEWKPDWKDKVKLIHFTSDKKPWNLYTSNWGENKNAIQDTLHSWKYPYFKLWRQYASESPWKDVPLDMPKNYKEWRYLSSMYWQNGKFMKAAKAYFHYLKLKI